MTPNYKKLCEEMLLPFDGKVRVEESESDYGCILQVTVHGEELGELLQCDPTFEECWGHFYIDLAVGKGLEMLKNRVKRTPTATWWANGALVDTHRMYADGPMLRKPGAELPFEKASGSWATDYEGHKSENGQWEKIDG